MTPREFEAVCDLADTIWDAIEDRPTDMVLAALGMVTAEAHKVALAADPEEREAIVRLIVRVSAMTMHAAGVRPEEVEAVSISGGGAMRDDLALPRLRAFVQRRGGTYWHSPRHGAHSALFGRSLTRDETDEMRRLADAACVENLAVIGPAEGTA